MSNAALPPNAVALAISGSDSGGGAGLQADVKAFAAHGVFGASVVTCVTAQNTREVRRVEPLESDLVRGQIDAVLDDLPVAAGKTGLLPTVEIVETVADALAARPAFLLVVDPVLVATSGDRLASAAVVEAYQRRLFPRAALLTPNLHEASVLTGRTIASLGGMRDAASALRDQGVAAVLVKGGHLGKGAVDVLLDDSGFQEIGAEHVDVGPVHGTGCVLSAVIAARLALGATLAEAVVTAKRFVHEAIVGATPIGGGSRVLRLVR